MASVSLEQFVSNLKPDKREGLEELQSYIVK